MYAPLVSLLQHRRLVGRLVGRELASRFKGSLLGTAWYVLLPLILVLVYTFVFGVVFQTRWPQQIDGSGAVVALYLFSGMLIFTIFAEVVSRSPTLIMENVAYVKKVVFPLEVLPWIIVISSVATFFMSMIVFLCLYVMLIGLPPATTLLLPILLVPYVLIIIGISWFLASISVFLRDMRHAIGSIVTIIMFTGPVFYPVSAIPERYRWMMYFNPVTIPVEMSKDLLFARAVPAIGPWLTYLAVSVVIASLGYKWFMKTKKAFADVI